MLLTISTTHTPATDLGYLLHKNPARPQSTALPFGEAHVFYSEATAERCTAALLFEVDPVGLVRRGPDKGEGFLDQYVNDRPYVASSFLSVAIARVFGSALSGKCKDKPELVAKDLPLTARLAALPCRGGESFLRKLFEPLGYTVTASAAPLDPTFPAWGNSRYFTVELSGRQTLSRLLEHLYVLIPVLDDDKHYFVGDDEVEKLLRHGEGWLAAHPERDSIALRYLKHKRSLARDALARLSEHTPEAEQEEETAKEREEAGLEVPLKLNDVRLDRVVETLKELGAARVIDLGCGEGKLIKRLLADKTFRHVAGVDVSLRALDIAESRLNVERMSEKQRERLQLVHGSVLYRDQRFHGFDAACAIEVIEHLEPERLHAFSRVVFEFARPQHVLLSTPNAEYNVKFETLPKGKLRHRDHRFEWTRAEFSAWCQRAAAEHGYAVRYEPIGPVDDALGAPTQLAVFSR